jgi:hypothetical protein
MFYKFDPDQLQLVKDFKKFYISLTTVLILVALTFIIGRLTAIKQLSTLEKELIVIDLRAEDNKFNKDKLVTLLKDLRIKYPHIVMAQSILETGHWKSAVFKQNHNLFGMKQAGARINTAQGTNLNHAYYTTWQESVYDYAFYQCRYLGGVRSEEYYYAALDGSYAEGSNYSQKLKEIVQRENLKELF